MKIRTMLIIVLACFIVIPSTVFGIVAGMQMKDVAMSNYTETTKVIAEKQAYNLSEYFYSLSATAKQIAQNPLLDEGNATAVSKAFDTYSAIIDDNDNSVNDILRVVWAKSDGSLIKATGNDLSDTDATKGALKAIFDKAEDGVVYCYSTDVFSDYESGDNDRIDPIFPESAASGDERLMVKYKAGNNYICVFYKNTRLKSFRTSSQFTNNSRLILIDSLGSIIDGAYIGNLEDNKNKDYSGLVDNAGNSGANRIDNFQGSGAGSIPTIGYTMKIMPSHDMDMGWTVSMIAETDRAYSASGDASAGIITAIVLTTIVLAAAGVFLVIVVTKPLKTIEETLVKVRRGDHEARINLMANNEYGDIARAFNELIDDIIVSENRYRTIIEMSDNIIFEWNFKTNEVFFSNNFNKKFSYRAPSDHFGDSFLLKVKVHPEDNERYHKDLEKLSKGEEFSGNEYRWKNIYGDYIWILLRTAAIRNREGNIAKIVGVVVDIDRAKKSEKMLTERASYDSLTGLFNRESIERAIENEIELISVRKSEFAVLFIDVDDFKVFNDKYSHATGDQVLKFVANAIARITEGFGTCGRYGGDEFIACIRNVDVNEPTEVAKKILGELKEGFVSDNGDKLQVNSSIGISIIKDSSMRVDEIIGMADDAMYKIKKSGKSNFGILNRQLFGAQTTTKVDSEDTI